MIKKKIYEIKDHHQNLTESIIEKMKDSVKYETPWFVCNALPYNPVTGTKYRGVNVVSLMIKGFTDPRFLTFKNIQDLSLELGESIFINKGEKGTPVFKAMQKVFTKTNEETGEEKSWSMWNQIYAGTVFNASQLTGMPPLVEKPKLDFSEQEEAEKIATAMQELTGLKIVHSSQGRACYSVFEDKIQMPLKENFKSSALYYRTLMHELGHSTGHESRLNRKLISSKGSDSYAFEELVAELSSYFIGASLGTPYDAKTHENHAAYLKSWIQALEKDKNIIFKAAAMASRSVEFQLNTRNVYYDEKLTNDSVIDNVEKEIVKLQVKM